MDSSIGSLVIVRTYSAGVHFGRLVAKEGDEVVLDGSRRIWRWYGANTLSELSLKGLDAKKSRVSEPVNGHRIKGWIEILPCAPEASSTIEAAKWAA